MNYLIVGNSFNLINREIEKLIGKKKYESYNLEDVSFEDVLENVGYTSMFEEEKIIVVKRFETILGSKKENEKNIERLVNYLKNSNDATTIIFVSSEKISSRGTTKELASLLKVVETPVFSKPYELSKVFGEEVRKAGFTITPNALNNFTLKCVSNYDIAMNELEKIKSFKKDNKNITERDVEEFVSNYNTSDLFGFKDAVLNKNISLAISMLDDLETSKMELVPCVVMLAKEYQTLYNIKILANKRITNDQIGIELGNMHPYRVKVLRDVSTKYTEKELEKLILELCNLDLRITSEDNLGFDELRKFLILL